MDTNKAKIKKVIKRKNTFIKNPILFDLVNSGSDDVEFGDESFFQLFLTAINKVNRSEFEVNIIAKYLNMLKEFSQLIRDSHSDSYKDLIYHISHVIKYEKFEKSEMLFRQGDRGDKFYIILRGSVSILIPKLVQIQMTETEYLNYLIQLKQHNEIDLISKLVPLNRHIYSFDEPEIEKFLRTGTLSVKGVHRKNTSNYPNSQAKDYSENIKALLKLEHQKSIRNYKISTQKYLENLCPVISDAPDAERETVSIYEYNKILSLNTGDRFGEIALSSANKKRTATIITEEETHFGTIDKKSYEECLKELNEKEKRNYMNFLISNQLFSDCNKSEFINSYFNLFAKTKVFIHQRIIAEDTYPSTIYFIKNGEYQVTANKSLLDIDEFIKSFGIKIKSEQKYHEMMNSSPEFYRFMKEKKLLKIAIIKDMEILGLENMISNNKFVFNVECISATGQLFALDSKFFEGMAAKDKHIKTNKQNYVEMRTKHLLKRLIQIRKTKLKMFFKKDLEDSQLNKMESQRKIHKKLTIDVDDEHKEKIFTFMANTPSINRINSNLINTLEGKTGNNTPMKIKLNRNGVNDGYSVSNLRSFASSKLETSETIQFVQTPRNLNPSSLFHQKSHQIQNVTVKPFNSNFNFTKNNTIEFSNEKYENITNNFTQTPVKFNTLQNEEHEETIPEIRATGIKKDSYSKIVKNQLFNLNSSTSKIIDTNYKNFIKFDKNKQIDDIYSSFYKNEKSSQINSGITVNFVDPLASDDFQRVFNTLNYYNCFSGHVNKKENKNWNEKINSPSSHTSIKFSKSNIQIPKTLTNTKKTIYFKGKIFTNNSRNLVVKKNLKI